MRKTAGLLAVVLLLLAAGCSAPADEPAKKWVAFLDKHKALVNEDKFKVDDFKKEGQPIVDELKKHRDPKEGKILMTQEVLDEWNRAAEQFIKAAQDKLNLEAINAVKTFADEISGKEPAPSNAPANG